MPEAKETTAKESTEGRSEQEIYDARKRKADSLRALSIDPYATSPFGDGRRTQDDLGTVVSKFSAVDGPALETDATARADIAGRIVAERSFGKAGFLMLRDRSGTLQVYVKKDVLGDAAYEVVKLAEMGDVVTASGKLFRSKTGELTLSAEKFQVLTKALRPLPEKWHGLTDVETRYRQRYLDLVANEEVRTVFLRRSRMVQGIRRYFDEHGFLEVETPMMHPLVTGAAARPFTTHHNALDLDLYLRIAPELYLKRLVVGGFERVYEINRNFRNEGLSVQHNPEFTMLEFYWAYATYEDLMRLTEELFTGLARNLLGGTDVPYQGETLRFTAPFERVTMAEAVQRALPELAGDAVEDMDKLRRCLPPNSPDEKDWGKLLALLFEQNVEHTLRQPTFITGFPTSISPLARKNDAHPELTDRFELYAAGREIANGFNELNDPVDQRQRFEDQLRQKQQGNDEAMDYDADYIRALEQGMPPTAGEGIGIDRLAMLLCDAPSIRDVILFPLLKKQT